MDGLVRAYKPSDGSSAGFGMLRDLALRESPDCPTVIVSDLVESGILCQAVRSLPMPIVTISLDDKPNRVKDKVRLPTPEHRLVHLKLEPTFLELSLK